MNINPITSNGLQFFESLQQEIELHFGARHNATNQTQIEIEDNERMDSFKEILRIKDDVVKNFNANQLVTSFLPNMGYLRIEKLD